MSRSVFLRCIGDQNGEERTDRFQFIRSEEAFDSTAPISATQIRALATAALAEDLLFTMDAEALAGYFAKAVDLGVDPRSVLNAAIAVVFQLHLAEIVHFATKSGLIELALSFSSPEAYDLVNIFLDKQIIAYDTVFLGLMARIAVSADDDSYDLYVRRHGEFSTDQQRELASRLLTACSGKLTGLRFEFLEFLLFGGFMELLNNNATLVDRLLVTNVLKRPEYISFAADLFVQHIPIANTTGRLMLQFERMLTSQDCRFQSQLCAFACEVLTREPPTSECFRTAEQALEVCDVFEFDGELRFALQSLKAFVTKH